MANDVASHHELGLAGRMAQAFIHSPITPLLLLMCLAVGIIGLIFTPRQEDPQISVPMVDIFVSYPGASAEQVASLVADPLERLMSEIPGVDHVYSASRRGEAMVTVQYIVGEAMNESLVKLYDKLASNLDKIPPGVSQPVVKPKSADDVPVVTLTLWSNEVDDSTLNLIGLDVLQRIKEVANTSQSFIVSGRSEQARIEVLPEKLAGYGISLEQIANAVQSANSERSVGEVEAGNLNLKLYTGAFLNSAEDIEALVIGVQEDRPIYVRDVANVILGPSEAHRMVRYYTGAASDAPPDEATYGASAVTLAIAKKEGSNGVTVAAQVLEKVEQLKGRVIPDNVEVAITRNYGETAAEKVNELIFKLFVATGAVGILVLVPLGFRAAAVVLIVIPVVILVTVFFALLLGYTIDRVSLFALIFSIGVLVDDAIVVVENIYRRWALKGSNDTETSVDAVREVGNPTILATFTVIAALLPMGFVSGMMGPYMEPIPALGSVAMLFSLFAAFIFTPWLAMRLAPSMQSLHAMEEKEHRFAERLDRFYRRLLHPFIDDRKKGMALLVSIVLVFFVCCALFYTKAVRVKMLPLDNKPEFNVVVNMPEGTALPVTANLIHRMAEELRRIDEVTAVQTYAGTASPFNFNGLVRHYYLRQNPWEGDLQVQLLNKKHRARTSHDIAVQAREILTPIARDAGGRVQIVEMPPGPPVLQTVVAEIYGPDAGTRRQVARDLEQKFMASDNIADVDTYLQEPVEQWRFEVDREKALHLGISVDTINQALGMAMGGHTLGDIKGHSLLDPTLIVLQLPLELRNDFERIGQLPVTTQDGRKIPLAELGTWKQDYQDQPIYHKDLRPVEYVTGEGVGVLAAPIYGMFQVEDALAEADYKSPDNSPLVGHYLGAPDDMQQSAFEWGGEWTVTYETFRDMGMAFGVALILIYMLVVWEFGNFLLPAIVMAPIPLTLIGIIPGHWLFGAEFTATSMIGFIALAGIIVRNSILLVEFTKQELATGVDILEALVRACASRTRPILITAFALVAGSSVILFDPIFQGMAISLMFGVLVSTLLTLLVIPLGCYSGRNAFGPLPVGPDGTTGGATLAAPGHVTSAPKKPLLGRTLKGAGIAVYYLSLYLIALIGDLLKGLAELLRIAAKSARTRSSDPAHPVTATAVHPPVNPPEIRETPTATSVAPKATKPAAEASPAKPSLFTVDAQAAKPKRTEATPRPADDDLPAAQTMPEHAVDIEQSILTVSQNIAISQHAPAADTKPSRKGRRGIRLKTDLDD